MLNGAVRQAANTLIATHLEKQYPKHFRLLEGVGGNEESGQQTWGDDFMSLDVQQASGGTCRLENEWGKLFV